MKSPPPSSEFDDAAFDPSQPFRGIVVCCTSIPANERTDLAAKVLELGGLHKYDLTPDVTHLVVGEHNTQKYKHVAKSRPDIRPMAIGWVDAVRNLWVQDDPIDFPALETKWSLKPFETGGGALQAEGGGDMGPTTKLLCCISGFEDYEERSQIIDRIKSNGGEYTGSLDRTVTHLIVYEPAGKKYIAAKRWGLHIVTLQWVEDSIERGMILDEAFYDPLLPPSDIGQGAWTTREVRPKPRAKRQRDPAAGVHNARRKLRKTASMKLNSQRENMWGEILAQQPSAGASGRTEAPTQPLPDDSLLRSLVDPPRDQGLFATCHFGIFHFQADRVAVLAEYISSRGGQMSDTIPLTGTRRFVIVPQDSRPDTHPSVPDGVDLVTEFFIERCVHGKRLFRPQDHVLGRPFPAFPIEGFHNLAISTSGFVDLALSQVERTIRQLGARYEERFSVQCSVLVCDSLASIRKGKLEIALIWKVPVVRAEWLWQCISQGKTLPMEDYVFPEVEAKRTTHAKVTTAKKPLSKSRSVADMRQDFDKTTRLPARRAQSTRVSLPGPDMTAFDTTTALGEKSANDLNKASSSKPELPPPVTRAQSGEDGDNPFVADGGDAAEAEARRLRELERREKAAAEQGALRHKLTTLLEGNGGVEKRAADIELPAALPPPPRRKRDIMGRAISNISAASTESHESGSGGRALSRTHSAAVHRDDESPSQQEPEAKMPTATQLEYDDPEAAQSKARLMSKMLGRSSLGGNIKGAHEGRVTMGGLLLQQDVSGDRSGGGRSTRRR